MQARGISKICGGYSMDGTLNLRTGAAEVYEPWIFRILFIVTGQVMVYAEDHRGSLISHRKVMIQHDGKE